MVRDELVSMVGRDTKIKYMNCSRAQIIAAVNKMLGSISECAGNTNVYAQASI